MKSESPCRDCPHWEECFAPCQEWKDWFAAEWQEIQTAGRALYEGRADHLRADRRGHE